jgi:hypothetical protein
MWLIIPREEDRYGWWGRDNQVRHFIGVRQHGSQSDTLEKTHLPAAEAYSYIISNSSRCKVLVLDPKSLATDNSQQMPQEIAEAITEVFIHFGGSNLHTMTLPWIYKHWPPERDWKLPHMPHAKVMPMTRGGYLPWQQELVNFMNEFLSKKPFTLNRLTNAWNIAYTYYHIGQPTQAILESLFPLFVDLSNHEICELSELELNVAWNATTQDLERRLAEIKPKNESSGYEFLMGCLKSIIRDHSSNITKAHKCAEDCVKLLELFEKNTPIPAKAKAVKEMFNRLSDSYSNYLGLKPVIPTTNLVATATT